MSQESPIQLNGNESSKSQGRGRTNSLPSNVVDYLKAWIMSPEHINHPYPTEKEKEQIIAETGIELKRLNNWFVNNRIRYWKPKMDALHRKQQKQTDDSRLICLSPEDRSSPLPPRAVSEGQLCRDSTLQAKPALPKMVAFPQDIQPRDDSLSSPVSTTSLLGSLRCVSEGSTSANSSVASAYDEDVGDENSVQESEDRVGAARAVLRLTKNEVYTTPSKRQRDEHENVLQTPRSKYSRKNVDLWRLACSSSAGLHDENLPSLEEATLLFGYSD